MNRRLLILMLMTLGTALAGCKSQPAEVTDAEEQVQEVAPEATPEAAPEAAATEASVETAPAAAVEVAPATQAEAAPAEPAPAPEPAPVVYPAKLPVGPNLDIVVDQKRKYLLLTNRTAKVYENVEIWLNRGYVATVDRIAIGSGIQIPLEKFIDRHGRQYPVAGILTPDKGYPVVLTEVVDPHTQQRHRLLTRKGKSQVYYGFE